jgi:hypothetical protein
MFGFNLIKRLPKKPLLGPAVLALALVAAGGGMAKRADAAGTYTIEVSWDYVHWSSIDDGVFDHTAEVYGTLGAHNNTTAQNAYRMMGNAGHGTCTAQWPDLYTTKLIGPCNKKVDVGPYYYFHQTPLSPFTSANQPAGNYTYQNNKVFLQVSAGQSLTFIVDLWDYDATSANDPMCRMGGTFTFTDAQLQTLSVSPTLKSLGASDGTCTVGFQLHRV